MVDASAGDYDGGFRLTCILYEGTYTVGTSGTVYAAGTNYEPTYTLSAAIAKGDYVGLHVSTDNTYDLTYGIPVVTTAAAAAPIIGRVVTEPRWNLVPQSTTATWAADLARKCFRTAVVEFFCVTAAHKAINSTDNGTFTVGGPVLYDVSADGWEDATTAYTGAFTFHYGTGAGIYVLLGFGVYAAGSGDTDCAGIDTVA